MIQLRPACKARVNDEEGSCDEQKPQNLHAFKDKHLEEARVAVLGHAPLRVMISNVQRVGAGPTAARQPVARAPGGCVRVGLGSAPLGAVGRDDMKEEEEKKKGGGGGGREEGEGGGERKKDRKGVRKKKKNLNEDDTDRETKAARGIVAFKKENNMIK